MSMDICIIGAGYVGLVTGTCFSDRGHNVTYIDVDKKKINLLNSKKLFIHEKELDKLLKKNHMEATSKYEDVIPNTDIIFICVGTPSEKNGSQDLSYVKQACRQIGRNLGSKSLVVMKSSVVPGTTEDVVIPILETASELTAGKDFSVAVNPEFLREGSAVYDFQHPDRIIIGHNGDRGRNILWDLYKVFDCPKIFTSLTSAEMIKYASNAFLSAKISFINEIGNICKKMNVDVYEVAEGMGYDKRIGRDFLNAGIGWGGSCFPKDTNALISKARELGEQPIILENVVKVNEQQPLKLLELLKKHINNLEGKEIGVLGLAFKAGTDDIRESRSIPIIRQLLKEKAIVKAYDPKAMENFRALFPSINYCNPSEILVSDAVLILTDWKEFESLNFDGKLVIDGRRLEKARNGSNIYEGICW